MQGIKASESTVANFEARALPSTTGSMRQPTHQLSFSYGTDGRGFSRPATSISYHVPCAIQVVAAFESTESVVVLAKTAYLTILL